MILETPSSNFDTCSGSPPVLVLEVSQITLRRCFICRMRQTISSKVRDHLDATLKPALAPGHSSNSGTRRAERKARDQRPSTRSANRLGPTAFRADADKPRDTAIVPVCGVPPSPVSGTLPPTDRPIHFQYSEPWWRLNVGESPGYYRPSRNA